MPIKFLIVAGATLLLGSWIFSSYRWHNRYDQLRSLMKFNIGDRVVRMGRVDIHSPIDYTMDPYLPTRMGQCIDIAVRRATGTVEKFNIVRCSSLWDGGPFRNMTSEDYHRRVVC